jgi:myo-inositol 2-dehydrogenase/D-chiro-inositol 1-dehydrogenase
MIQEGALGELELIRTTFTTGGKLQTGSPEWSSWRTPGGGVLFDLGVHHFDLWRYLTGAEVEEISAVSHSRHAGEQTALVTARMDNGVLISSVFSDQTTDSNELEICGRKGSIRVSCYRFDSLEFITAPGSFGGFQKLPSKLLTTLKEIPGAIARISHGGEFHSTYKSEWRAFANSIRSDTPIGCTPEDGRHAVQISLAALASDSESRAINVSEFPRKNAETPTPPSGGGDGGQMQPAKSFLSGAS